MAEDEFERSTTAFDLTPTVSNFLPPTTVLNQQHSSLFKQQVLGNNSTIQQVVVQEKDSGIITSEAMLHSANNNNDCMVNILAKGAVQEDDSNNDNNNSHVHVNKSSKNTRYVEVVSDYFNSNGSNAEEDMYTFHEFDDDAENDDGYDDEYADDTSTSTESFKVDSVRTVSHSANGEAQVVVQPLLDDFNDIPEALAERLKKDEQLLDDEDDLVLIDIDPNALPLSSSPQLNNERDKHFRNLFEVPPNERVVEEVYCAYYRKMPNQGRMYISQNFVCFTSNIFGYKINLTIPFSSIILLEKKYTAIVVPNAIEIVCKDGQTHFFGSFVFRDQTFKIIEALWNLHHEQYLQRKQLALETAQIASDLQETNSDPLRDSEEEESDGDEESGEDEEEDEDEDEEVEEEEEEETENQAIHYKEENDEDDATDFSTDFPERNTTTSIGVDEESEVETGTSMSESVGDRTPVDDIQHLKLVIDESDAEEIAGRDHPLKGTTPRTVAPTIVFTTKNGESSSTSVPVSTGSSSSKKGAKGESGDRNGKSGERKRSDGSPDDGGDDDGDDRRKKRHNNHSDDADAADDAGDEEDEEDVLNNAHNYEEDDITDLNAVPTSDIFPPKDKFKPKEIVNDKLPCTAEDFFFLITADGSDFESEHHITRGDTDFSVSPWVSATDGLGKVRDISFMSPVSNPLGPKITKVKMIQRLVVAKGKHEFVIQSNMHSCDVPYADCFRIINYIYVKDTGEPNTCQIRIELGVYFLKSTLLRWKIEDTASKETTTSYCMWHDQAKAAVIAAKEKGQLKSQRKKPSSKAKASAGKTKKRVSSKAKRSSSSTGKKTTKTASAASNPMSRSNSITIATPVPATATHSAPSSAVSNIEESTLSALLTEAVGFILSLPEKLKGSISIPAWLIIIMCLLALFVVMPRQSHIIKSLDKLQTDLRVYKLQTTLFEMELNNILFNMSSLTDEKKNIQVRTREDFNQQLKEWYKHKSEIHKQYLDNDVLHQILYQIETMKKEDSAKGNLANGRGLGANIGSGIPSSPHVSQADMFHYQQQMIAATHSHMNILTWTVVGFLGLIAIAVLYKVLMK